MTTTHKRPRSAIGESLHVHGEAVDLVETLYLQAMGEVTEEIEEAEAARDVSARDALEHVARFLAWCDDQDAAVERERERLADLAERTAKRRAWAQEQAVMLAEAVAPGRTKVQVGTRVVKIRRTTAVETGEGFDVQALPESWRREVPEKVTPASVALDKTAAKADLLLGYREGEPPSEGWYDVEGHGRVWLTAPDETGEDWLVETENDGTTTITTLSAALGCSIDPQPGLDVLRWRPSPPGVQLVHRVHVKVG